MYRAKGFTLFELVITIAIAAIVLGIAVPSYRFTIDSSNIVAELSDLKTMSCTRAAKPPAKDSMC